MVNMSLKNDFIEKAPKKFNRLAVRGIGGLIRELPPMD